MKKIKLAFYRNSKSIFGKVIRFQQKNFDGLDNRYALYSHVEIVFESFSATKIGFSGLDILSAIEHGISFSSSEQDGGTRFKVIKWKKSHWDFFDISVTDKQYTDILNFCISQNNKKYNWLGIIFSQGLKSKWFVREMPHGYCKDWYCSQIVTRAIQAGKMLAGVSSLFTNPGKLKMELDFYFNKQEYKKIK